VIALAETAERFGSSQCGTSFLQTRPVGVLYHVSLCMNRILCGLLFLSLSVMSVHAQSLTVAVAANLERTFQKLRVEFTKETGIDVTPVVGSSGKLTAQIEHGAPYDLFLSADSLYPARLFAKHFATTVPKVFARGVLTMWTTTGANLNQDLKFLADASIRHIAVADPRNAPFGVATIAALKKTGMYDIVASKIVYAESISQVNQYIETGSVEVGFTSLSSTHDLMGTTRVAVVMRKDLYMPIPQTAVILKYGAKNHTELAAQFMTFLFSDAAQNIFVAAGYTN
jgi:molybdate transport system substrate-binding protein